MLVSTGLAAKSVRQAISGSLTTQILMNAQNAHPECIYKTQGQMDALNAHPERMPTLLVTRLVKIVTPMPTNRTPMLQNAYQCKKVTINRVQQPK